jgi:molecular chaperone DnaJ
MSTHYEILGVPRGANADDLRRAFRRQAKLQHPDAQGGTAAKMIRLTEAYDILRDPGRRAAYDRTLKPVVVKAAWDPVEFKLRVFQPLDRRVAEALEALEPALAELVYDIYDDRYIARFGTVVGRAAEALADAQSRLFSAPWPDSLASALNLYRQGLRQADDAIEDFETFEQNFDSDVLVQGCEVLQGARDLLDEARGWLS